MYEYELSTLEKEKRDDFVEPSRRKNATYVFDLNERALAVGDVLTYLALASDNKEPESQIAILKYILLRFFRRKATLKDQIAIWKVIARRYLCEIS